MPRQDPEYLEMVEADRLRARVAKLEAFAQMTLSLLADMTTDKFSNGGDKPIRDEARRLLGKDEE